MRAVVLGLAIGALVPTQAGSQTACTEIGCSSGVSVGLKNVADAVPGAARVTVCVGGRCRATRRLQGRFTVVVPAAGPSAHVLVVVYDAKGRRLRRVGRKVALQRSQPNGPDCPPVCWYRALSVRRDGALRYA